MTNFRGKKLEKVDGESGKTRKKSGKSQEFRAKNLADTLKMDNMQYCCLEEPDSAYVKHMRNCSPFRSLITVIGVMPTKNINEQVNNNPNYNIYFERNRQERLFHS